MLLKLRFPNEYPPLTDIYIPRFKSNEFEWSKTFLTLLINLFPKNQTPALHLGNSIQLTGTTCFKSAVGVYLVTYSKVLVDRSGYNNRRSYFPGFFTQDVMTAAAYQYARVGAIHQMKNNLSLLIVDRKSIRSFSLHSKLIPILSSRFKVQI